MAFTSVGRKELGITGSRVVTTRQVTV